MILLISLLLAIVSLLLLRLAARQQRSAGLPTGRVIASDTHSWKPLQRPLYDPHLNLTGKPDYLVRQGRFTIPVEVKSAPSAHSPFENHIFQLAAYCLLVERAFGERPPYGILHYSDKTYRIEFTPELENALNDLLSDMRAKERLGALPRSHASPSRCAACGFRSICDQRLSGD